MPKRVSIKGRGADLFFGDYTPPPHSLPVDEDQAPRSTTPTATTPKQHLFTAQAASSAPTPRLREPADKLNHQVANDTASTLASYQPHLIESIRRQIKVAGREVSFVRLTPLEKEQLADVLYALKKQGRPTTENEINRIAVNFILRDYQVHGDASILSRVIDALLA